MEDKKLFSISFTAEDSETQLNYRRVESVRASDEKEAIKLISISLIALQINHNNDYVFIDYNDDINTVSVIEVQDFSTNMSKYKVVVNHDPYDIYCQNLSDKEIVERITLGTFDYFQYANLFKEAYVEVIRKELEENNVLDCLSTIPNC